MFYVYVLQSRNISSQTYVGYTTNLTKRLENHNAGEVKSTKPYKPWALIFYEAYKSSKDAKRREKYLKTNKGKSTLRMMLQESLRS